MTTREQLLTNLTELLLDSGINDNVLRSKIILELDKYEISERTTDIAICDETDNENLIRGFALAKTVSGRSPQTVKQYLKTIHYFTNHINKKLIDVTAADIRAYTAYRITHDDLHGYGLINERQYLNTFFDWLESNDYITKNPIKKVEKIKIPQMHKEAFTDLEVEKLRTSCKTLKEKAILETMLSTACRVSELISIKIADIDNGKVMVRGKGNKFAYVYLNAASQLAIENYLKHRKDTNEYLFPGHKGKAISLTGIRRCVKRIGNRAGVTDVHPHKFRHTAATSALRKGMKIEMVSKMLRHSNLNTTMKYIDLDEEDLRYQHSRYVG